MEGNNNKPMQQNTVVSSPSGNSLPLNQSGHQQGGGGQQQAGYGPRAPFQMSQYSAAQAQAIMQAQAKAQAHAHAQAQGQAAHAQAQAQAAHAQFQAQSHAQAHAAGMGNVSGNSPAVSNASNSSGKRHPQKSQGRPPGFSNSNAVPPLKAMELTSARKKKKLPEKHLQDKIAAFLPQSSLYTQLLEFESRVDAAIARKKIDIQEAVRNLPCTQKKLRIYVFNTFANQIRSIPTKPNAEPPTWTFKIVGRILEEGVDPEQAAMHQQSNPMYPKFSSFFKRVTISLDQRLYPDNHIIIWDSSRSPAPHEGFEVKRRGDKEFTLNVRLEVNYMPEKYKLSPALTELLGIEVETRSRIIAGIWHYVKARKLQNPNDPTCFTCDPPLQKVFGEDKLKFTMVSQKISNHLAPPQPIHLEHRIKLSGNSPTGNACYDILVDVPFPIQKELNALLANTEKGKEIEACDEAICRATRKIHEHRKRRAFFLGFSQSPVEFVNALVESQSTDLNLLAGEASRSAENEHQSEFYNQTWVEDAVIRYLNRDPAAAPAPAVAPDAPGST